MASDKTQAIVKEFRLKLEELDEKHGERTLAYVQERNELYAKYDQRLKRQLRAEGVV